MSSMMDGKEVDPRFFLFQSEVRPAKSLATFVARLCYYCAIAPDSIVRAVFCIGTFRQRNPAIPITPFTVQNIILVA